MSRDTESVMSSAVSLSGVESFSDDGSTVSEVGDKAGTVGGLASSLFDLGDGDLHLIMNGASLETHKFLIKRFAGLRGRIKDDTITLDSGEPGLEVFRYALKIMYASVIEGPFDFDHTTLTSTLLLATKYIFPALRAFAIDKLEKAGLNAVERIRLAREFDIPSWEEPAFLELCGRDESLTMPEAEILGLKAVLYVGIIREKEQRRKREEAEHINKAVHGVEAGRQGAVGGLATMTTLDGRLTQIASLPGSGEEVPLELELAPEAEIDVEMPSFTGTTEPLKKPNFANAPDLSPGELNRYCSNPNTLDRKIELPVLDCDCKVPANGWSSTGICKCKLPPCAISAFKHLQTQQLAHRSDISALKSTIEQMQIATTHLKPTDEPTTDTVPPSLSVSCSLQNDVKQWFVSGHNRATVV